MFAHVVPAMSDAVASALSRKQEFVATLLHQLPEGLTIYACDGRAELGMDGLESEKGDVR